MAVGGAAPGAEPAGLGVTSSNSGLASPRPGLNSDLFTDVEEEIKINTKCNVLFSLRIVFFFNHQHFYFTPLENSFTGDLKLCLLSPSVWPQPHGEAHKPSLHNSSEEQYRFCLKAYMGSRTSWLPGPHFVLKPDCSKIRHPNRGAFYESMRLHPENCIHGLGSLHPALVPKSHKVAPFSPHQPPLAGRPAGQSCGCEMRLYSVC